jgi:hypothetical protein
MTKLKYKDYMSLIIFIHSSINKHLTAYNKSIEFSLATCQVVGGGWRRKMTSMKKNLDNYQVNKIRKAEKKHIGCHVFTQTSRMRNSRP